LLFSIEAIQAGWGYSAGFVCKQFSKLNPNYSSFLQAMLEGSEAV
jgi:hypothetical protein